MRTASGTSRVMANRNEIDALLTRIGIIMEDGTECLLSRKLDEKDLNNLVTATLKRIETMQLVATRLRDCIG